MEAHVFKIVENAVCVEAEPAAQLLTTVLGSKMCFMQFRDMRQCTVDFMGKMGKWGVLTKWEAVP